MVCKVCGKEAFIGHQIIRADVQVDSNGDFEGNLPGGLDGHIYDSEKPYGPFTCIGCGAEYDELAEDAYPVNFHRDSFGIWKRNGEEQENLAQIQKDEIPMKRFGVRVVETLKRTIIVKALNIDEAVEKVETAMEKGEIILGCDDYDGCEIEPSEYWRGGKIPEQEDVSRYWKFD